MVFISESRVGTRQAGQVERQRSEGRQLGFAEFKMYSVLSVGILREPGPCSTHIIAQMSFSQEKLNKLNIIKYEWKVQHCIRLCEGKQK